MSRPVFKWLLFAACLAVFLSVMAWISARTLDMERQRVAAERDAQVQERTRLALWRMDSLASTLLIRENSRPPGDYQAFRSPDDLFTRDNKEITKGKALMPSPLLGEPPELVLLHFEVPERTPMTCSPQVPTGVQLELANNWYAISPQLRYATERLGKLDALLKQHPEVLRQAAQPTARQLAPMNAPEAEFKKEKAAAPKEMAEVSKDAQSFYNRREQEQRSNVVQSQIASEKVQASKAPLKKVGEGTVTLLADAGAKKAEDTLSRTRAPAASMPAAPAAAAAPKPAPTPIPVESPALMRTDAPAQEPKPQTSITKSGGETSPTTGINTYTGATSINGGTLRATNAPGNSVGFTSDGAVRLSGTAGTSPVPASQAADVKNSPADRAKAVAQPRATTETTPAESSGDLKPVWIDNELLLVRTATLDGKARTQGVWVDWAKLRGKLLDAVGDLLPLASLSPALADAANLDPSLLVTLPVKLTAGAVSLPITNGWSPLQRSLAIAWICLGIAAAAIALVLHRAMLLSERRGAFVSAVTHELRTPLTTFQLYSEMLADDMVPDASKRREYLRTLCDESTRLTHLVENVLAYSRIERGRTAARVERVTISALIARIEPRLRRRCEEVDLSLEVSLPDTVAALRMNVDAMGVEQILFNLADNACKYAAPQSEPRTLHLNITAEGPRITFRVRDHGPGISRQQQKRLFQPFEKSATDAAHSAPGVGLGLALCRRLAREMGGDLVLEKSDGGACFALELPR